MFDITRTTGRSPGSLRSMNDVVMPAATEMTSRSPGTVGAISSSRAAMSCGFTVSTRVSAALAAAAALATCTP